MYHPGSSRHLDVGTVFTGLELVTLVLSVHLPFHVNVTDTKMSELEYRLGQNVPQLE